MSFLKQWIEPTCLLPFPTLQIICNFTQRVWKRSFSKRYVVQVFQSNLFVGFSCSCPFPMWNCMYHLLILEFQLMVRWIYVSFWIAGKLGFRSKPILVPTLHTVRKLLNSVGQPKPLLIQTHCLYCLSKLLCVFTCIKHQMWRRKRKLKLKPWLLEGKTSLSWY